MTAIQRAEILQTVSAETASGVPVGEACARSGISPSTFARWSQRYASGGLDALDDLPRTGRPPLVRLTPEEAAFLRRTYLRSNLRDGAGSMSFSARWAAKDDSSPLSDACRAAILKPRSSKHLLPVAVRRALRASEAEVRRHRDPKSGLNDGLYTPGWLRMSDDGSRRLLPRERQVWDDASVNVGVVVPWTRGGDRCADRFGVRVARFQLLAGIDCATDFCPGYSYIMRPSDGYTAADVAHALWRVWSLSGYAPDQCVMEGGSWQAARTCGFLSASGAQLISAKGRPNQKLVEGWFNRLWTVMSVELPPCGQVGRFRGEMAAENQQWRRCREGAADPREFFPLLTDFLRCLDRSIAYLNDERVESREYGSWIPSEAYAATSSAGHVLPQGLRRYALPVREIRKLTRQGMVRVTAESPFGWPHSYAFSSDSAWRYDGADVWVSFDPSDISAGAILELASAFQDSKAGTVIDAAAPCVSPAPELLRTQSGFWQVGFLDARAAAKAEKRSSRAKVGSQVAAFDERGRRAGVAEHEGEERLTLGDAAPQIPEPAPQRAESDWAALEAAAGVIAS